MSRHRVSRTGAARDGRKRGPRWRHNGGLIGLISIVALIGTLLTPSTSASAESPQISDDGKIAPGLQRKFERSADLTQDFWVSFDATADTSDARAIADWAGRGAYVVDRLQETARQSQADAIAFLEASGMDYTPYWIVNAIWVDDGHYVLARQLAAQTEVESVFAPVGYEQPEPIDERLTADRTGEHAVAAVEWGLQNIRADQVWQRYGVRGDGIVVASIDSGVEFDHPALVDSYRGNNGDGTFSHDYNWYDASGQCDRAPCDNNGHGTHTMGTMVGDDGAANQIGVAPGATWITANGCATCAEDHLIASAQWMLAPTRVDGTDPDPAMRPNIINNSWGTTTPTYDPLMEDVQTAWADAGIFGAWANGPACNTSGSPGSRTLNYSVGAYDSANLIASFSSRGAGQDGKVKPNISAPGVNVRSALPGGQYAAMSGASMATPHVAGVIALLWSADPSLVGDIAATRQLLDDTADDSPDSQCGGTDDDNNVYGEGRLDALALMTATQQGETGTITGVVTEAGSGEPVGSAVIELDSDSAQRSIRTGADGSYTADVPAGDYQVTVSAFGHETKTTTISVAVGQTTTTDIELVALPGYTVSGKIVDQQTGRPIPGAEVTIVGTRLSATTAPEGTFAVNDVPGPTSYTVHIDGGGCSQREVFRTVGVDGDVQIPTVELARKTDASPFDDSWGWGPPYGYSCIIEPTEWIPGDTEIPIAEVFQSTPVDLPFPFTYFGEEYRKLYVDRTRGLVSFWTLDGTETGQLLEGLGMWTDANAVFDSQTRLLSRTSGTAPNRSFTIEYRDLTGFNAPHVRFSLEVTLHENGDFVFAYKDIDPDLLYERGANAAVRLHDHSPDGTARFRTTFTYSEMEAVLDGDRQIHFSLPPNGFVNGTVVDHQTGEPVAGATVDLYNRHGTRIGRRITDDAGHYRVQLFTGQPYQIAILKPLGYVTPPRAEVTLDRDRQVLDLTTRLPAGRIDVRPGSLTLEPGGLATLTLKNSGTRILDWRTGTYLPEPDAPAPGTELSLTRLNQMLPLGVEEVDGSYWVAGFGDMGAWRLLEMTTAGNPTGAAIDVDTVAQALGAAPEMLTAGDLAWVEPRGWLCLTLFPRDSAKFKDIVCVDPAADKVTRIIPTGFGSDVNGVDGLAYDAAGDRFFVIGTPAGNGGYHRRVRTLTGVEHPDPGQVLSTCTYPRQIQGLAWNPGSRTLWSNTQHDLRQSDPVTCAEISSLPGGFTTGSPSTGLDLEPDGDFVASTFGLAIATIRSPDRIGQRLPWLSISQASGTLQPRKSVKLTVAVDWTAVPDGITQANLVLRGNGGARPLITIPLTLQHR